MPFVYTATAPSRSENLKMWRLLPEWGVLKTTRVVSPSKRQEAQNLLTSHTPDVILSAPSRKNNKHVGLMVGSQRSCRCSGCSSSCSKHTAVFSTTVQIVYGYCWRTETGNLYHCYFWPGSRMLLLCHSKYPLVTWHAYLMEFPHFCVFV